MRKVILSLVLLSVLPGQAIANDLPAGAVKLLDKCPGDGEPEGGFVLESLLLPVLTPLLTGIVGQGLKSASEKLKAAAQDAQVDVLHAGGHQEFRG